MFYAIATVTSGPDFDAGFRTWVARKGWKNASNNDKVRHDLARHGYNVVICEFENTAAAKKYAAHVSTL